MFYCAASSCLISISRHHSISQSPDSYSQTTMEWFLRSPCTEKYFPDFSVTHGGCERGWWRLKTRAGLAREIKFVFHCQWCPGTRSFYARGKNHCAQIIVCENYFQKPCSRGVYTICFTQNWGNLNQPAPGPGHISSKWQLVIMNVIFSSPACCNAMLRRWVCNTQHSTRPGGWRKTFMARKWWWTITVSYIRNYDNFVGVL